MLILPTKISLVGGKKAAAYSRGTKKNNHSEGETTMSMVQWSNEFSVDIQEIDEQHKLSVNYINEIYAALTRKDSHALTAEVIHKLVEYTKIHFAVEETVRCYPHNRLAGGCLRPARPPLP